MDAPIQTHHASVSLFHETGYLNSISPNIEGNPGILGPPPNRFFLFVGGVSEQVSEESNLVMQSQGSTPEHLTELLWGKLAYLGMQQLGGFLKVVCWITSTQPRADRSGGI